MLVYGDRAETVDPVQLLTVVERDLLAAAEAPREDRDDLLRHALIAAGEVAQGLLDAEFTAQGQDDRTEIGAAAMALVGVLARKLAVAWKTGNAETGPDAHAALRALMRLALPERISCKRPEGYAYYAVYPEAYIAAAARCSWPSPPLVIGLRSIGTGLAGAVAAAVEAADVITLRPHGHPFHRQVSASDALIRQIRSHSGPYAIVDEGPGLSGSSFGAVADLLEGLGVGPERILFMPSHDGDLGPEAEDRHRLRWTRCERVTMAFEELWRDAPPASWFADLIGEALQVDDISAGRWRAGRDLPAQRRWERRKFRITACSGLYLAKFAGLSQDGHHKFARAQVLSEAGFSAAPRAIRRGFILEDWVEGATPDMFGSERACFLRRLGDYLGFRASAFPVESGFGARSAELVEMVRVNGEFFVPGEGDRLAAIAARLERAELSPVHIDGRLHPWEWVRSADGRILKTDAIDHSCAHDLIGCQDIGWDVAGAIVEYGLDPEEAERLAAHVKAAGGRALPMDVLAAFEVCYAAFQAGAWRIAGEPSSASRKYVAHLAKRGR